MGKWICPSLGLPSGTRTIILAIQQPPESWTPKKGHGEGGIFLNNPLTRPYSGLLLGLSTCRSMTEPFAKDKHIQAGFGSSLTLASPRRIPLKLDRRLGKKPVFPAGFGSSLGLFPGSKPAPEASDSHAETSAARAPALHSTETSARKAEAKVQLLALSSYFH